MKLDLTLALEQEDKEQENLCVMRLIIRYQKDILGIHITKSLVFCEEKSKEHYNMLAEDCDNIGIREVINRITNLDTCKAGYYSVSICNARVDYWTGSVEDYDYKLVPYTDI